MSFSIQVAAFARGTPEKINRIKRGVSIKLFTAIILDTPVDTGRLRSNWQCTLNTYSSGTTDIRSQGSTISAMQGTVLASAVEADLCFSNNLDYAEPIEFRGVSHTKAPDGMVRKNITRFHALLQAQATSRGGVL